MEKSLIKIYLELCHPSAKAPCYAREGDAGMDICAVEDQLVSAGSTVDLRTGLKAAIPKGYELQIRPRSGLSLKTGLRLPNSPGTIDSGYRDEIGVIIHNTSPDKDYWINKGDRIAQMVLKRVPQVKWEIVDAISEIGENRGGGFGSSGR